MVLPGFWLHFGPTRSTHRNGAGRKFSLLVLSRAVATLATPNPLVMQPSNNLVAAPIFAIARLITALRAGSDKAALLVVYLVAVPPI